MKWIKDLWSRLFVSDADEPEQEFREPEGETAGIKPPFRFPLISDQELYGEQPGSFSMSSNEWVNYIDTPPEQPVPQPVPSAAEPVKLVKLPKPVKKVSSSVYEPVRPGMTAVSPQSKPVPNPRYRPTRVPSPVYGFQPRTAQEVKPAGEPLEEQKPVNQKLIQESMQVNEHLQKKPVWLDEEPRSDAVQAGNELPANPVYKQIADPDETITVESHKAASDEPVAEQMQDSEVPLVSLSEENGIHREEQEQQADALNGKIAEQETPARAVTGSSRGKSAPFNVLMLKSDRERLQKKNASKTAQPTRQQTHRPETQPASRPSHYALPESRLLLPPESDMKDEQWMAQQGRRLIEALSHFQVKSEIIDIMQGPAVTQFELKVANGVKVSKIRNLADDLKLALAAEDIRIQAPIPGKSSIGIEIPNRTSRPVRISEIIESDAFKAASSPLEAVLGLDLQGRPVTADLRKMPHGLIAGATGSGKSVCINSLLISLLYKATPQELKLLLIDPKMVELAPYNNIPHLISPVITDVKAATASLKWAVSEMERRYQLFAHAGVRDIGRFNKLVEEKGDYVQRLPYIMIVIDELADLMMMAPAEVEDAICRIAQKARACGIHLIVATQRPSVDVITGLIKANIPTRIAFTVSSQVDSRTILDAQGAERLLGRGDMLYLGNGMSAPVRLQGTYVTDEEIEEVIAHVRKQGQPDYFFKEDELVRNAASPDMQDDLFEEACRFILSQGSASTSLLQRRFHIGYNRAARLMDLIEQYGFVSEQNGSKARDVLMTEEELEEIF
ncbi:DNA translocase FtsK [Planococcus lenghuensis]|uniref:Cell division protein FtsK n=1 Tax=Planococcus lenghuensis TaxID=2213202 RepID=A0A1Q2KX61_9BACL|nr:DNA translocase FtsK [Planococcus lenghuensis]AQQ52780.1 cell division protein FtsK [Planococcus lenghuensis]